MPYIVKLCYLPLLNDNSYYFTQPFQVSKVLVEGGFTANNISFNNDEIKVTVDDTLGGTSDSNLFKSNYNCLLLYNEERLYFEVYHITQINFIGGKQVSIRGYLTHYTIDKYQAVEYETEYRLRVRDGLKSKCGFIRYGYAYDSVLKTDGTLNLDGKGVTDIYVPLNFASKPILSYRKKLGFRSLFNDDGTPNDTDSIKFSRFYKAWVYVYCEPRSYEGKSPLPASMLIAGYGDINGQQYNLPYGIICAPITNEGYSITINGKAINIKGFINQFASYIYSIKISPQPPFKLKAGEYTITNNRLDIQNETINNQYNILNTYSYIDDIQQCILNVFLRESTPLETTPIYYDELYPHYPRGFDGQSLTKAEFENFNLNPYIKGNGIKFRITDGLGGIKDYTPFDLGFINNYITFKYYEVLSPDITKIYLTPNTSNLTMSLLKSGYDETYNSLINNVDLSIPFSVNMLQDFLANNKNFFNSAIMNSLTNAVSQFIGGGATLELYNNKPRYKQTAMLGSLNAGQALGGLAVDASNIMLKYDDLVNKPDTVSALKSNFMWLLMIQQDIKPTVEIYTATDYELQSAYNHFCEYGIKLDKFINETEISKYINIITLSPHDKKNYKYVEVDIQLYGDSTWYLEQQRKLSSTIRNGLKLVNLEATIDDNPNTEYDIMLAIKEEEFNFE